MRATFIHFPKYVSFVVGFIGELRGFDLGHAICLSFSLLEKRVDIEPFHPYLDKQKTDKNGRGDP